MGVQVSLSGTFDRLQICSLHTVPKPEDFILWQPMGSTGHQLLQLTCSGGHVEDEGVEGLALGSLHCLLGRAVVHHILPQGRAAGHKQTGWTGTI